MIQNTSETLDIVWMASYDVSTNERNTGMDKQYLLFGQKIKNLKTNEIGLVIYTWDNQFADGKVPFATCVDKNGKNIILKWII